MLELLSEVRASYDSTDFYFGGFEAVPLRQKLAELPPDAAPIRLWRLLRPLAFHEMRLGNTERAIELYRRALEEVQPRVKARIDPAEVFRTRFDLGVAWLRLGETANCVARHTSRSCILPIQEDGVHVDQQGSRAAIAVFEALLRDDPENASARWLLNIACMTVGEWPDGVPERWRVSREQIEGPPVDFPRFVDVAGERGIDNRDWAGGAIADDFDGDGLSDLVTTSMHPEAQMRFWHGNGDGTFEDRTERANLLGITGGLNCVQGDYDNDGDLDLLVLRGAWLRAAGRYPDSLLQNQGDGTFLDVTFLAGLAAVHYPSQTGNFADYDNDGDLDLAIGNETDPSIEAPCQLFQNQGDGTFVDVAERAGVRNMHFAKAVVWGDVDEDGWPDLYVSNQNGPNRLYRNRRDGTFEDIAEKAGVVLPMASFPSWFFDFDNDGHRDLMVWSYMPELEQVARSLMGLSITAERPRLYKADGKGGFRDVAQEVGIRRLPLPMGSNFEDVDGDGWLDFYLGTGFPGYEGLVPNVFYWNRGGTFVDVTHASGMGHLQKGHGVTFADFDRDGDVDVFEQMGGAFPGDGFGDAIFLNPGFGNHWVEVRLVGTRSNRFGVGAHIMVEVEVETDGGRRTIHRWVDSGGSFGARSLVQRIGIGKATRVAALEVRWPTSSTRQRLEDLAVDRRWTVTEGAAEPVSNSAR